MPATSMLRSWRDLCLYRLIVIALLTLGVAACEGGSKQGERPSAVTTSDESRSADDGHVDAEMFSLGVASAGDVVRRRAMDARRRR